MGLEGLLLPIKCDRRRRGAILATTVRFLTADGGLTEAEAAPRTLLC